MENITGTIWTDFKPQIEGLDKKIFSVIAWDPPGYGKSRPPDRTFPINFYERDAEYANNFMKALGYHNYSLIGWSDGGISSLILAARHSDNIRKMIVFGSNSYILPEELKVYQSMMMIVKNIIIVG